MTTESLDELRMEILSLISKDGAALGVRIVEFAPFEHRAALLLRFDPEMGAVPLPHLVRILRLNEDSADAGDSLHFLTTNGHQCTRIDHSSEY